MSNHGPVWYGGPEKDQEKKVKDYCGDALLGWLLASMWGVSNNSPIVCEFVDLVDLAK